MRPCIEILFLGVIFELRFVIFSVLMLSVAVEKCVCVCGEGGGVRIVAVKSFWLSLLCVEACTVELLSWVFFS